MPFGMFKQALASGQRTISKVTNRDLLEGIVCGALYLAASGGISREEYDQLLVSLSANKALEAFGASDLAAVAGRFREKVEQSPRMAKIEIRKEVEEAVNRDASWGTIIVSIALDVADQGGLDADETARAKELCGWCRVSADEFGL